MIKKGRESEEKYRRRIRKEKKSKRKVVEERKLQTDEEYDK
jgi:hypothetical protein